MATPESLFAGVLAFIGFWILLIILGYIFWLWMFIHALINRDVLWIILFIFSFFTGFLPGIVALVYYFAVYRKMKKHKHG